MYRRDNEQPIPLEGRKVGPRTQKAELIEFTVDGREEWLPKSQVYDTEGPYGDDMDLFTFHVSSWWAGKNGYA